VPAFDGAAKFEFHCVSLSHAFCAASALQRHFSLHLLVQSACGGTNVAFSAPENVTVSRHKLSNYSTLRP